MNTDSEPVQEPAPIVIAADSTANQIDTLVTEFPVDTLNLADTLANLTPEPVPKAAKAKPKEEKKTVVVKKKVIRHRKVVVTDTVSTSTTNP